AVEVEVVLLHVLAVVPFAVRETEETLLENGVPAVPEGERKADPLLVVGDAGQSVLPPAVGAGSGLVMSEVVPGVAALAVVLAHGPPLPLAEVRPPLLPGGLFRSRFVESPVFRGHRVPPSDLLTRVRACCRTAPCKNSSAARGGVRGADPAGDAASPDASSPRWAGQSAGGRLSGTAADR